MRMEELHVVVALSCLLYCFVSTEHQNESNYIRNKLSLSLNLPNHQTIMGHARVTAKVSQLH